MKRKVCNILGMFMVLVLLTIPTNANAVTPQLAAQHTVVSTPIFNNNLAITASASFWDWLASFFGKNNYKKNQGNNPKKPTKGNGNNGNNGNGHGGNNGSHGQGGQTGNNNDAVPLDGGLIFLVGIAAAFGAKKLKQQ